MLFRFPLHMKFSVSGSYTILGLKSTAKLQQVKKKYYQLAKQYHPDINQDQNANVKFAEINKAYKIVLENYDPTKSFGPNPKTESNKKTSSQSQASTNQKYKNQKRRKTHAEQDQFQDFFEYDSYFKSARKFRKPKHGEDIYINIKISLQESIIGTKKQFTYQRYEQCPSCSIKQFSACFSCGGKGLIYDRVNRQKVSCTMCSGKGFKNECLQCFGSCYICKDIKDNIYIEKGTQDKTILKVQTQGHRGYKSKNGDLYVTVLVQESDKFIIDGNNVYTEYKLDYAIATCGGLIKIETLYGIKQITIEAGTQSGSELRLFNYGLKSPYSKRMGDQIIKIRIKLPDKLNQKQKILLKQLYEFQY